MNLTMEKIIDVTQTMLTLAREKKWQALTQLEQARLMQLKLFFDSLETQDKNETLMQQIRKLQTMDAEMKEIAMNERTKIRDSITQMKKGKQVKQAYKQVTTYGYCNP